jgi:hypothetical protein
LWTGNFEMIARLSRTRLSATAPTDVFIIESHIHITKEHVMSKGQNRKKGSKKEPVRTMQEKKAAKREKKAGKMNPGILTQELK